VVVVQVQCCVFERMEPERRQPIPRPAVVADVARFCTKEGGEGREAERAEQRDAESEAAQEEAGAQRHDAPDTAASTQVLRQAEQQARAG